jgi:predicted nucleotidyltransferase
VDTSDPILQVRRPETKFDPTARTRRSLYRSYAQRRKLKTICSNTPLEITYKELLSLINNSKLTLNSPDKTYECATNLWLRLLLKRRFFALASNWLFQCTLIMTTSELVFRFVLEFAIAASVFAILSLFTSQTLSAIAGVLIAHTINWTLNGNFWAVPKFFGRRYNIRRNIEFLKSLKKMRRPFKSCVVAIAVFGSLSRGQFNEASDLDMRIVRQKGFTNWVKANLFMLKLRSKSFLKKIPMDAFLLDRADQVYEHISHNESPVVIYDPKGILWTINDYCILLKDLYPAESS